jgi:hypothetical protein|tara:strand:+ start:298 stop:528 length:231 start_codon:yes stop_codon:yes gene_type:complete
VEANEETTRIQEEEEGTTIIPEVVVEEEGTIIAEEAEVGEAAEAEEVEVASRTIDREKEEEEMTSIITKWKTRPGR